MDEERDAEDQDEQLREERQFRELPAKAAERMKSFLGEQAYRRHEDERVCGHDADYGHDVHRFIL